MNHRANIEVEWKKKRFLAFNHVSVDMKTRQICQEKKNMQYELGCYAKVVNLQGF